MKRFLLQVFTWWNGQTIGTRFYTWRHGKPVGEDEFGNLYYQSASGRRWVVYNGEAEASRIPAGWHGWIHHTVDTPPSAEDYRPRPWQKPAVPNLTGTPFAYRPRGSILTPEPRAKVADDYDAWSP